MKKYNGSMDLFITVNSLSIYMEFVLKHSSEHSLCLSLFFQVLRAHHFSKGLLGSTQSTV